MDVSSIFNSYNTELQKSQLEKLSNLSNSGNEGVAENTFKTQLMLSMIQQMFKDSDAYSIVMEAFASAMKSSNFSFDGLFNTTTTASTHNNDINSLLANNSENVSSSNLYEGVDEKVAAAIEKACNKYNMDPSFIMAVIRQESNFNSKAVSGAGATGIMQIMPFNFANLGITDPYDVEQNIDGGTKMLSNLLDTYKDKKMALAAYNAGSGTLANRNIKGEDDFHRLPSETQNYIKKVSAYEEMYNNKYV